jgi:hypothetical protein
MVNSSHVVIYATQRLRAGWSGDRIPVGGEIFCSRPDRPWGPPSLLCNGYRVSFTGVNRPGRGVDHPPSSSARVKERVELYLYSPSGPSRTVLGRPLPYTLCNTTPCLYCSHRALSISTHNTQYNKMHYIVHTVHCRYQLTTLSTTKCTTLFTPCTVHINSQHSVQQTALYCSHRALSISTHNTQYNKMHYIVHTVHCRYQLTTLSPTKCTILFTDILYCNITLDTATCFDPL